MSNGEISFSARNWRITSCRRSWNSWAKHRSSWEPTCLTATGNVSPRAIYGSEMTSAPQPRPTSWSTTHHGSTAFRRAYPYESIRMKGPPAGICFVIWNLRSHIPKSMRLHRALSKTESLMFRAQYSIALELGNYWTVAVTTKLASLSLVRLEKPKMFRVISCNLATEPPRETG